MQGSVSTVQVLKDLSPQPQVMAEVPLTDLTSIKIDGAGGNDTLTVDLTGGNPIPATIAGATHRALWFIGGSGTNTLDLKGTQASSLGSYRPETSPRNGVLTFDSKSGEFTDVDAVTASNFLQLSLVTPNINDTVTVGKLNDQQNRVTATSGSAALMPIDFDHVTRLFLNLSTGESITDSSSDKVTVSSDGLVGAPVIRVRAGSGANSLNVLGPSTDIDANFGKLGGQYLTVNVGKDPSIQGSTYPAIVNIPSTQLLDLLHVFNGSRLNLPTGAYKVLAARDVQIETGATLDLASNDMIVRSGDIARFRSLLYSGYNNGTWTGKGIVSSASAGGDLTMLGLASSAEVNKSEYSGQALQPTDIVIRYSITGDLNYDKVMS